MITYSDKYYSFSYKNNLPEIFIINPILENFRYKIYRKLEQDFITFFTSKRSNNNISPEKQRIKIQKAFGRWIMLQISFGNNKVDPLIPSLLTPKSYKQLEEDIRNFTRDKSVDYNLLIKELDMDQKCTQAIDKIKEYIKTKNTKHLDKTIVINSTFNSDTNMYTLDAGQDTRAIEVSKIIYDRTKILFISNNSFSQNLKTDKLFYYTLYCLMLRYITISEDGVRQGAKPQVFFDALFNEFSINFECFAAGFAASTNYICSLFYDIEQYFGSYGNFFDIIPTRGFYQVNPPLDSLITIMAMKRVMEILDSDKNHHKLGFICFIPAWDRETIKAKQATGKLEIYEDFPIYYDLKKNKHLILNYDIINKQIIYVQYQGKYQELGIFDSPHIMILGNQKFKQSFDHTKMQDLLDTFITAKTKKN